MTHVGQPVLAYVRQSYTREDGDTAAIDRQEHDCRAYATAHGLIVLDVIPDNKVSATSRKRRPGFEALLKRIKAGEASGILVWSLDRLARRPVDLERVIDLDVPIYATQGGADLSTVGGRVMARVLVAMARGEIETKSGRQVAAAAARARNGQPHAGGPRTPGYLRGLTALHPTEAPLIRDAFSSLLAGGSLRSIARTWNAQGMTTAHGGKWDSTSVRSALRNPRYAALSVHRAREGSRDVLAPGRWPALVTEEVYRAAVALLDDPARRTTPDTARRYLGSGLYRCAECAAAVISARTSTGSRLYRCSTRRHFSRAADPVDAHVLDLIAARLRRPDAAGLLARPDVDVQPLRDELAALRIRLDSLSDLFVAGTITTAQLTKGTATARQRAEELEAALGASAQSDAFRPIAAAQDPGAAFLAAALDQQRAVIAALVRVTLHPAGRGARTFDPVTVDVTPLGK